MWSEVWLHLALFVSDFIAVYWAELCFKFFTGVDNHLFGNGLLDAIDVKDGTIMQRVRRIDRRGLDGVVAHRRL